ncbi:hypothetical protein IAQ61_005318 [Plenodomus lingam]|uniref:uncharacterized protein n=1 Tax=Leptosphaeria maculans TaxID=5022 RepID=UPI00331F0B7F|nr:hypothetical protein IAQ61_005318 [Plenodomus lingam]
MAMDNTTLHTFLFHCPSAQRSIALLGSWDNFSRPYPLKLDARRGCNIWKGCFTFSDIICDGDLEEQSTRRDGLLKMGGTYWYYYKVDENEECHNPSEPSTTVCPLLPGQRLNVLEVPRERHSRSNSESSATFTRNPDDRYLTPVPPAALRPPPSLRSGSDSSSSYSMSPPSPWAPRSATYVPAERYLSPNVIRHARSASASPRMPSTPMFPDFKVLKEKLASKRSAARTRSSSKSKELEIGSPVLVSSTVSEDSLIPLSVYRPSRSHDAAATPATKMTRSIPSIRKQFSPLASNPVDPTLDGNSDISELAGHEQVPSRRRSHVPSTIIASEFQINQGRIRANSADTRRTQHYLFSNDPWLSSPKREEEFVDMDQIVEDDTPAAPTLQRHISHLHLPGVCQRPTSSHGHNRNASLRDSPLDKDLPALPRYITPAPLFACNFTSTLPDPSPIEFPASPALSTLDQHSEFEPSFHPKPRSHFSTWSRDSLVSSSPTSDDNDDDDDDAMVSPSLGSFTSSYAASPLGLTSNSFYPTSSPPLPAQPTTLPSPHTNNTSKSPRQNPTSLTHTPYLSPTPPQLDDLRISTFNSDFFALDTLLTSHNTSTSTSTPTSTNDTPIHPSTTTTPAAHRQATCFGLGFHYTLPAATDATASKATLRHSPRASRVSVGLGDEFAFLGGAVVV